jgi:alanine dehydrogenase
VYSDRGNLEHYLPTADLVVGAVLLHGHRAPHLISRDMLADMRPRAVIVDVAVDQGGCVETTRPTTHEDPTYYEEGILHYCVANMPGAVPQTSTAALTSVTLPYALRLADHGVAAAVQQDPALASGVNVWEGRLTCEAVADSFGMDWTPLDRLAG